MAIVVKGYTPSGGRIVEDLGPLEGRPHQRTYGTRAVIGGTLEYGQHGPVEITRTARRIANSQVGALCRELRRKDPR